MKEKKLGKYYYKNERWLNGGSVYEVTITGAVYMRTPKGVRRIKGKELKRLAEIYKKEKEAANAKEKS